MVNYSKIRKRYLEMRRVSIVIALIALFGCTKFDYSTTKRVVLNINFQFEVATKSGAATPTPISNLLLLIYNSGGDLEYEQSFTQTEECSIKVTAGAKRVVAIANLDELQLPTRGSYNALASTKIDSFYGSDQKRILIGECFKESISARERVTITLKELVAKITFIFDFEELDSSIEMEPYYIAVRNSAKKAPLLGPNTPPSSEIDAGGITLYYSDLEPLQKEIPHSLYIFENCQGTVVGGNSSDIKLPTGKEHLCSYIEAKFNYKSDTHQGGVTYRYYPGNNPINNFDIERGKEYRITLKFSGSAISNPSWQCDLTNLGERLYSITAECYPPFVRNLSGEGLYSYGQYPPLKVLPKIDLEYEFQEWIPPIENVTKDQHYIAFFKKSNINFGEFTIAPSQLTLQVGESFIPTVTATPAHSQSGDILWQSSDASVASIVQGTGKINALSPGTTSIIAKSTINILSDTLTCNVYQPLKIEVHKYQYFQYSSDATLITATLGIYIRAQLPVPSNLQIVAKVYDYVSVNVGYCYFEDGKLIEGDTTLRLSLIDNNDFAHQPTNCLALTTIDGVKGEGYIYDVFNSLQFNIETGAAEVDGWRLSWGEH